MSTFIPEVTIEKGAAMTASLDTTTIPFEIVGRKTVPDLMNLTYTIGPYVKTDEHGHLFEVTCDQDGTTVNMYEEALDDCLGDTIMDTTANTGTPTLR